ncbi:(d)CMP kinase [Mycoplasma todarodis]|uniref:Cytidylate kinase n=1 Tax=Mycoplasma todarodis TaxID=1937191 RepID=A0A4R0XQ67_9MOLU|nr:(d)CMP kinase [Mycoplasma todarodis]TCG10470.1 (d)CMP kinase [Mycoplasma todarodis]
MNKKNIAIDGPASSGKSTVAKIVAKELGYIYINTGLMYRTVAYNAIQNGIDLQDEKAVSESFVSGMIKLLPNEVVELNGKKLINELRDDIISNGASTVARYESVRAKCVSEQQKMAEEKGVVMDGRDITSIVLPNAEVKVFMWASPEERANRRVKQNNELGYSTDFDKILKEINDRDYQDMNREIGPLVQVEDAVKLDTTDYSIEQVVEEIIKLVK